MAAGAPGGLLSPALFQARVIPVLLRLFAVHEEHVRVVLLSHLEAYVEHFTPEQLRKVILPQVRHGRRGLGPEPGRARGSSRSRGPGAAAGGKAPRVHSAHRLREGGDHALTLRGDEHPRGPRPSDLRGPRPPAPWPSAPSPAAREPG